MSESSEYDMLWENWGKSYGFWHEVIDRQEQQIAWLAEQIDEVGKDTVYILDIGCGEGLEIKQAADEADANVELIGNDISGEALERYKRVNDNRVTNTFEMDFNELPKEVFGQFDLILFSHCLHDADLIPVLETYRGLLSNNGLLCVLLESRDSTITQLRRGFWSFLHDSPHTENVAENVVDAVEHVGMQYEITPIEYGVSMDELTDISEKGLEGLYLPFGLRTRDIPPRMEAELRTWVEERMEGNVIPQKTLALTVWR